MPIIFNRSHKLGYSHSRLNRYAISAAAVARGFSSNMILFFDQLGAPIPYWLVDVRLFGLVDHSSPLSLLLCLACTAILLVGVKESARVNMVITILNVLCILFIVVLGSLHIDSGALSNEGTIHNILFQVE